MSERVKHATLAEAMHAIMADCQYLQKASADKLKYRVLTERQVNEQIRPLLLKHGVIVTPHNIEKLLDMQYEVLDYSGKPVTWHRQQFKYTFKFQHLDTPEFELVPAIGEANNNGDKGSNSCATIAQKYAIKQAFYMETGDDPDLTPAEDTQGVYHPAPAPPPPRPAPPPKVETLPPAQAAVEAPVVLGMAEKARMVAAFDTYLGWSQPKTKPSEYRGMMMACIGAARHHHPTFEELTKADCYAALVAIGDKAHKKDAPMEVMEAIEIALEAYQP